MKACGWGLKRITRELGCSHHTVKHYVAAGGVVPFKAPLPRGDAWLHEPKLDGYRQQVVQKGRQVRLYNERGNEWTHPCPTWHPLRIRDHAA